MKKLVVSSFLSFGLMANAKVTVELGERSNGSTIICEKVDQTMLYGSKLKVAAGNCGFSVSKKIAEENGFTLGEIQRIILDYSKDSSLNVTVKVLEADAKAIAVVTSGN